MKNVTFINQIEGVEVVYSPKAQLGRPVNPDSVRQQRLASAPGKRTGRPVNPNSERQLAIAARQALLNAGVVIKRGRPVGSGKKVENQK